MENCMELKKIENETQLDEFDLSMIEFYRCGSAQEGIGFFCKKDNRVVYYYDNEQISFEKKVEFMQKLGKLPDFSLVNLGMGYFLRMKNKYVEEFNQKMLTCDNIYKDSKKIVVEILSK